MRLGIQHAEQIYQPLAKSACVEALKVVVEHTVMPKNPGILGIQAKYQANAQLVQTFQRMFGFRVCVLLVKGIIQQADNFTCCNGNFHLPFEVFVSGIDKELQPIVFFFQICKFDDFRLTARALHIVHIESTEITGHDPARVLRHGQLQNIPLSLFKRGQQRTV